MRSLFFFCIFICSVCAQGQTLGGSASYHFLKLPSGALLAGTGGVNASYRASEVSLSANNPSLLQEDLHGQLHLSFLDLPAGIRAYGLTGAWHNPALHHTIGAHIFFVDYGSLEQTDASGNIIGNFRPADFVAQVSAGSRYLDKWHYGATLKFIHSSYGQYRSAALALDAGVHYSDTAKGFAASLLAKNMGLQLKTFAGEGEDLPFDLQAGVTQRLRNAPLAFSVTAQQLHHFNIHYNDTLFNRENDQTGSDHFFSRLFDHFVVASHVYLGKHLEASLAYNRLRRSELNIGSSGNGLNGFSLGLRVVFEKLELQYARSNYQRNIAFNQLGLLLHMDRFF